MTALPLSPAITLAQLCLQILIGWCQLVLNHFQYFSCAPGGRAVFFKLHYSLESIQVTEPTPRGICK